jgi:hypothetical protein
MSAWPDLTRSFVRRLILETHGCHQEHRLALIQARPREFAAAKRRRYQNGAGAPQACKQRNPLDIYQQTVT